MMPHIVFSAEQNSNELFLGANLIFIHLVLDMQHKQGNQSNSFKRFRKKDPDIRCFALDPYKGWMGMLCLSACQTCWNAVIIL